MTCAILNTRFSARLALSLAICSAPSVASVLVVDASGAGGAFTTLEGAIFAAVDGDTILVKSGTYSGLAVDGKSLVITADAGATVGVLAPISVRNLSAAQSVTVSGIDLVYQFFSDGHLVVSSCDGTVWFQDCEFHAPGGAFPQGPHDAAFVAHSQAVVFEDCAFSGPPIANGDALARGIYSLNTNLFVYGCSVTGGQGSSGAFFIPPADGASAVLVDGGSAWIEGSLLAGGPGGVPPVSSPCQAGGDGGSGLTVSANAAVTLHACAPAGGNGGLGGCGQPDGSQGPPSVVVAGTLELAPGTARTLDVAQPIREGQVVDVALGGEPGDLVFLLLNVFSGPHVTPGLLGEVLPAYPSLVLFLGASDAAGALHVTLTLGELGLESLPLVEQGLFFGASEGFVLSNGRVAVHLDAAVP